MIEKSLAKINLFLHILGKREDGYHEIYTLMHKIELFDYINIKNNKNNTIKITTNVKEINNLNNLSYKAASLFFQYSKIKPQVSIEIEKHIPLGGGLGGGSSNAAYTLKMLNKMFDYPITNSGLKFLASQLGSDVPFFLCEGPAAVATGRGEIIEEIKCDVGNYVVFLAISKINVNTAYIYSKLLLTSGKPINKMPFVASVGNCRLDDIKPYLENDLEEVTLVEFEELNNIKNILVGFFGNALLSGSGGSIFSIVNPEVRAKRKAEDVLVSKGVFFKTVNFSKEGR